MSKYDLIMADPPWDLKMGGKRKGTRKQELAYQTLNTTDIMALLKKEIFPKAKENHNLFLWTVDQYLKSSLLDFEWEGYRRHAIIIWDKCNGFAPAFTVRYSHEYLIWFYKGKFQPVDVNARGIFTTVITEEGREHSRKPDKAYNMLNRLYPNASKFDVFSREKREGWDQFGNQLDYFNE